jgi:CRP/FNR family transcriptional regulator
MLLQDSPFSHSFFTRKGPYLQLDPSAFVADPELIRAIGKHSTPIACDADRVLFRQGDAPARLYIIHSGEATLSMCSSVGKSAISLTTAEGSLLGLPGLIGNQPYTLTATALCGAQVSFIDRDAFIALMQSDPLLSLKILEVLAAEVRSARRALSDK